MAIELGDPTVAIWCVELPGGNLMMHLGRITDTHFALDLRFRWYRDDKIHDSDDDRSWYRCEPHGREADVLHKARRVFEHYRALVGSTGWELIRGARTADEFADLLKQMPGIHFKQVSAS